MFSLCEGCLLGLLFSLGSQVGQVTKKHFPATGLVLSKGGEAIKELSPTQETNSFLFSVVQELDRWFQRDNRTTLSQIIHEDLQYSASSGKATCVVWTKSRCRKFPLLLNIWHCSCSCSCMFFDHTGPYKLPSRACAIFLKYLRANMCGLVKVPVSAIPPPG